MIAIPVPIAEIARGFGIALMLVTLPFVVVESLSKKVDVVSLKEKLDLKEARLNAIVIGVVEEGLAPHLGTDLRTIGLSVGFDPGIEDNYFSAPQTLSDTAKDALVKALRRCDPVLTEVQHIRRIPNRVSKLNKFVYVSIVVLVIAASAVTASSFLFTERSRATSWFCLDLLFFLLLNPVIFAIIRQTQVQDAEQAIINEDTQPRA